MLPAKADPEKQKEFLEQELQPRLDEAQAGKRVVLFVDAAHFVLAPFLGFLWSVVRVFIQAPSGRQRFNVLGALNAITHELITITNETYINAESVCALLEKIANLYVGIPISIFLDNAHYQKCVLVREKAKSLKIELCFLPSYSPNLNLIETRSVWKFVKKKCLYSKYYEKFPAFKEAISMCLNETRTTYKSDLDSLLTLRFQLFQKAQFVTV
jgi:transposase